MTASTGVPEQPVVFLDFDGTITVRDATDAILEAFADPEWLRLEDAWKAGRIGSRDCLRSQMALVSASQAQIDALLDEVEIDTGLLPLLGTCSAAGVPVHIVSEGFDYCIRRILFQRSTSLARLLEGVRIVSSHLEPAGGAGWTTGFTSLHEPCEHGCGTCKPAVMARLNPANRPTIFVGDGLSDRHAAAFADLVFAKGPLSAYCDEHGLPYMLYSDLASVARAIDRHLRSAAPIRRASLARPEQGLTRSDGRS